MTPRSLQQSILSSDLLPSEKLVGLVISIHINSRTKTTKIRQSTIARESGLHQRSVRRAIRTLEKLDLLEARNDSGRSSFYRIPTDTNTDNINPGISCPGCEGVKCTFLCDSDTEFSTPAEEKNKREEARILREKADDLGLFEV